MHDLLFFTLISIRRIHSGCATAGETLAGGETLVGCLHELDGNGIIKRYDKLGVA